MDYLNIWLYTCATLVTLMASWKTIKFVGWKKKMMFSTSRDVAKSKGVLQGVLIWPAFIVDTALMPIMAVAALITGTIEKQVEQLDMKATETGKTYWNDKALTWLQEDFNKTKKDLSELIDVWVSDETTINLENRIKELEIEIMRMEKMIKEQVAPRKELYGYGTGPAAAHIREKYNRDIKKQEYFPFIY